MLPNVSKKTKVKVKSIPPYDEESQRPGSGDGSILVLETLSKIVVAMIQIG